MRYATLGRSGLEVPVLFLGCGNFGGVGSPPALIGRGDDRDASFAVMDAACAAGVRMFDTANAYAAGTSEQWVCEWLTSRRARDEILLTTKVGMPIGPGPDDRGLSPRHIREQIDASLGRLGTDRVDLYVAHWPDPATPIEETIGAFAELIRDGKIAHYGLSNVDRAQLEEALAAAEGLNVPAPANLQCGYSLLDRRAAASFEVCAGAGIGFTAYSPLAGGLLTGKYRANEVPAAGSRLALRPETAAHLDLDRTFPALDKLAAVAAGYGVPLATLALAWALTDPAVTALVVGARTREQLATMCAALDLALTADQRAELVDIVAADHG